MISTWALVILFSYNGSIQNLSYPIYQSKAECKENGAKIFDKVGLIVDGKVYKPISWDCFPQEQRHLK